MKHLSPILIICISLISCSNDEHQKETVQKQAPVVHQDPNTPSQEKATGLFYDTLYAQSGGKVEWLTPKGNGIKKRTHLFTINNSKNYLKLYNDKASFKVILDSLMENCPAVLQNIKPKWQKFDDQLRFDTLTPRFPKIEYKEEADYFATTELINSYNKMLAQEKQMKSNFEFAKRDYTRIDWKIKVGQKVKKGQVVAVTTN